jgi:hypothetical protein
MQGVAIVNYSASVTTTGVLSPLAAVDLSGNATLTPLALVPVKWAIQVTGYNSSNVITAPSAWDVILQPSLDGVAFNDMTTPFLEHKNATNGNGDVVTSGTTAAQFFPTRFYKIDVKTLTLGSASRINICVVGLI